MDTLPKLPQGWEYKAVEPSSLQTLLAFYDSTADGMPLIVVRKQNTPLHREIVRVRDGSNLGTIDYLLIWLDGWETPEGWVYPNMSLWLCRPWTGMRTEVWASMVCNVDLLSVGALRDWQSDFWDRLHHYMQIPQMQQAYEIASQWKIRPLIERQKKRR